MSSASSSSSGSKRSIDPVLRNALRYTVSAKEYKLLHDYLLSRAPAVEKRAPKPKRYEAIVKSEGEYNVSTVRASLRVLLVAYTGLKGWELLSKKLFERRNRTPRSAGLPSIRREHNTDAIAVQRPPYHLLAGHPSGSRHPFPSSYSFIGCCTDSLSDSAHHCSKTMQKRFGVAILSPLERSPRASRPLWALLSRDASLACAPSRSCA